jgi:phosphosulfolactate synthase
MLIDTGYSNSYFEDVIENFHPYIDYVKLGWCTSMITPDVNAKITFSKRHNVDVIMGGTFFEKALLQVSLNEFINHLKSLNINHLEISNGTVNLSNPDKAKYIKSLSNEFTVFSEVGFKDNARSMELHPAKWLEYINQDLEAGAHKVILEAREDGKGGVCRSDGEIRFGLINEIATGGIQASDLIFEAPNKTLQTYFIKHFGANANMANIAFPDVIGLETLRLGLRSDTLLMFEASSAPPL